MLEQIGVECAWVVTFMPEGAVLPIADYHYRDLNEIDLVFCQV
jgi:hypothetical protein